MTPRTRRTSDACARLARLVALTCALGGLAPGAAAAFDAPDPGGDELANVRLNEPGGKLFGFNETLPSWHLSLAGQALDVSRKAGGAAARMGVAWQLVEPVQGEWVEEEWAKADSIYDLIVARGMEPVITLGWAPAWARVPKHQACGNALRACRYPPAPQHVAAFGAYAAEAARRFPEATFAIWNEPNWAAYWMPRGDQPERWAALVRASYDAIKAVDPSIRVVAGGLATPRKTTRKGVRLDEYVDRAYRAPQSLAGHLDALAFNFFPQGADNVSGALRYNAGSLFADVFKQVRSTLRRRGDAGLPLWVTEIGLMAPEGPNAVTLLQQADALVRILRRTLTMPDVRAVLVYRLLDGGPFEREEDQNYGVMSRSPYLFTPKPAYCSIAWMASLTPPSCPQPTPIETQIVSGPPQDSTTSSSVRFGFSSTAPSPLFECAVDAGAWRRCGSALTLEGLADAWHLLRVRSYNNSGWQDQTPAARRFFVDGTAPETRILGSTKTSTRTRRVRRQRFRLASPDDPQAAFQCSLDGAAWARCPARWRAPRRLRRGRHVLRARAIDAVGNIDPTPAQRRFRTPRRR